LTLNWFKCASDRTKRGQNLGSLIIIKLAAASQLSALLQNSSQSTLWRDAGWWRQELTNRGSRDLLFAICYLLFLRELVPDEKMFCSPNESLNENNPLHAFKCDYGSLASLVNRVDQTIDTEQIAEQWDRMGQLYASLKTDHVTASVALKRLVGFSAKNRFYRANRDLGRIFKTEFILQYLSEPELRRRIRRPVMTTSSDRPVGDNQNRMCALPTVWLVSSLLPLCRMIAQPSYREELFGTIE
jgi:Tn3 transposase DDE domain